MMQTIIPRQQTLRFLGRFGVILALLLSLYVLVTALTASPAFADEAEIVADRTAISEAGGTVIGAADSADGQTALDAQADTTADVADDAGLDTQGDSTYGDFTYRDASSGTGYAISGYIGTGGAVVIPSQINGTAVTEISPAAFKANTTITGVTIPSSVTTVGVSAFYDCINIASITLSEGLTDIENSAFSGTGITSISLPNSLVTLRSGAFSDCPNLTGLNIPKNVTMIDGNPAFACSNIAAFTVDSANTAYYASDGVLYQKDPQIVIGCPSGKTGDYTVEAGTTEVASDAFAWTRLSSVKLPDTVTAIGSFAFRYGKMSSVTLSQTCETIGYGAFMNSRIASLDIPDSVTSLGDHLARNCVYLTTVKVGSGVTAVPQYAFGYDTALASVTLSEGLTNIGYYSFFKTALTTVDVPSTVTVIETAAFEYCNSLATVTGAENVTRIEDFAFAYDPLLTSCPLPDTLMFVDKYAFYESDAFTPVYPADLTENSVGDWQYMAIVSIKVDERYSLAWDALDEVNRERAELGLSPLTMNAEILEAATRRAAECALFYSHRRPNDLMYDTVLPSLNDAWECNAAAQTTGAMVIADWKSSPGHWAIIKDPEAKSIGIGCVKHNGVNFWSLWTDDVAYDAMTQPADTTDVERNIELYPTQSEKHLNLYVDTDDAIFTIPTAPFSMKVGDSQDFDLRNTNVWTSTFWSAATLTDKHVTWTSSDPAVASVDAQGKVTAKASGTATITATIYDGASDSQEVTVAQDPVTPTTTTWKRLAGENALDTMGKIVDEAGFNTGGTVLVATIDGYWDALTAAGAAGVGEGCVLLTDGSSLSEQTSAQLTSLAPAHVIVCGGTAAISDTVYDQVDSVTGSATMTRCAGNTATGTACQIYQKTPGVTGTAWSTTAVMATNSGYWDALAAAPYAYAKHCPIFLSEGAEELSSETLAAMKDGGIQQVYIVGGTAAVSKNVERQLASAGIQVAGRLAGDVATQTSQKIAEFELTQGMSADGMAVATRDGYWDALTGASLCGKNNSVLVLAADDDRSAIDGFVVDHEAEISHGYVFGGTVAVSKDTYDVLVSKTS